MSLFVHTQIIGFSLSANNQKLFNKLSNKLNSCRNFSCQKVKYLKDKSYRNHIITLIQFLFLLILKILQSQGGHRYRGWDKWLRLLRLMPNGLYMKKFVRLTICFIIYTITGQIGYCVNKLLCSWVHEMYAWTVTYHLNCFIQQTCTIYFVYQSINY